MKTEYNRFYIDREALAERLTELKNLKHISKDRKETYEDVLFMVMTMNMIDIEEVKKWNTITYLL